MERNTMIELSLIIPVYNTAPKFIDECLKSIDNAGIQCSYEIILVNDGSDQQNTLNYLQNIDSSNQQVLHKENGGASSARNVGLKKAKGEFILCLDADDLLLPSINRYIDFLKKNSEFSVAYGDVQTFGDIIYKYIPGEFSSFRHIYIEYQPHTTSLFRRSILEKVPSYNENFAVSEDWDFWSRIAAHGFRFHYMKEPLFLWRKINDGKSLSRKSSSAQIRHQVLESGKAQFNAHKEITIQSVNLYVLNSFKKNKIQFFKLGLFLFIPSVFRLLIKVKIFKNDIIID